MRLVVDASVALKWFFQGREGEDHVEDALDVLDALDQGHVRLIQPPHFLAEMAAVLIREKGETAYEDLRDLQALDWEVVDEPACYEEAMRLAATHQHHLFDTLYHATALRFPDGRLLTADRRYHDKAAGEGRIELLGRHDPLRARQVRRRQTR